MPFAFSQIEPRTTGELQSPGVSLGRYLSASADQGFNDNIFSVVGRMVEDQIYKEGPILQPDELNKRYGIKGELNFDKPEYEAIANLRNTRKRKEMERAYYLGEGSDGLFSGRGLAGLGVGMLASMANPLDLGLAFMPITGSLSRAKALESAGVGGMRVALAKGLITEEAMIASRIPAPKFFSAMIDGTVSQAAVEIPLAYQNVKDQANYGLDDFFTNIALGGAFSGAINLTGRLLEPAFRKLAGASPEARETMLRQAIQQVLRDEEIKVHNYVKLDDAAIIARAENELGLQAEREIDMGKLQEEVLAKFDEKIVSAAVKTTEGEIKTGPIHALIERDTPNAIDGFVTDSGRFITRDEASELAGITHSAGSEDFDIAEPEFQIPGVPKTTTTERNQFNMMRQKGETVEEARQAILDFRQARAAQALKNKLNSPAVQKAIAEEKQRQINEWREVFKPDAIKAARDAEIKAQIESGKTLSPEDLTKWEFGSEDGGKASIDEQSAELDAEVRSMIEELGDEAIDVLEKLKIPIKGPLEGVTGTPIWLWNGAIDAVQLAIRAGQKAAEAIEAGVKFLYENWHGKPLSEADVKYENFQEGFDVPARGDKPAKKIEGFHMVTLKRDLSEDLVKGSTVSVKSLNKAGFQIAGGIIPGTQKFEKQGMDRRGFLGAMGKALAATQLPIPTKILENPKVATAVVKGKLPSITLKKLFSAIDKHIWNDYDAPYGRLQVEEDTGTNEWIREWIRQSPEYEERFAKAKADPEFINSVKKNYSNKFDTYSEYQKDEFIKQHLDGEFNPDSWTNNADLTVFKRLTETPLDELDAKGLVPHWLKENVLSEVSSALETYNSWELSRDIRLREIEARADAENDIIGDKVDKIRRKYGEESPEYLKARDIQNKAWSKQHKEFDAIRRQITEEGVKTGNESPEEIKAKAEKQAKIDQEQQEADALANHFRESVGEQIKKIEEARKQELKDLDDEIKRAEAEAMNPEAIAQALNCLIRKG
jgi:hypothetical protein